MEYENDIDFGPIQDNLNGSLPDALFQAMEHIHTETTPRIPLDTGNLKASGEVESDAEQASLFYPGPYALYQHEGIFYRYGVFGKLLVYHRGGERFFLEKTILEEKDTAIQIVADGIRL
jgi:hypothetical protein